MAIPSIRIGTKIDDKGVTAGLNRMQSSFSRLIDRVIGGGKAMDSAWGAKQQANAEKLEQRINRQNEAVSRQEALIESLKSKMDALGSAGHESKQQRFLETELKKESAEATRLQAELQKVSVEYAKMGRSVGGDPIAKQALIDKAQELKAAIADANANVEYLNKELSETAMNPQATEEGAALQQQIQLATDKLIRLKGEAEASDAQLASMMSEKPPAAEKGISRLNTEVRNTRKESSAFDVLGKKIDAFKNRITKLAVGAFVFNGIRRALRSMADYMGRTLSTNKQFMASLNSIKGSLATAFAPIYNAIMPALNTLMSALAKVMSYFASFVSMLFGKSVAASAASAAALDKQASALGGAGGAAKKAAKDLAAFDEINTLEKKDESGGGGGGGGAALDFSQAELDPAIEGALSGIVDWLQRLWETALPTREAIAGLWEQLKMVAGFAWQGIVGFYDNFLKPVGTWVLGDGLPRLANALKDMLANIDWGSLVAKFDKLWAVLSRFAIAIGEGLLYFWENTLMPLAEWLGNTALPWLMDKITAAVTAFTDWAAANPAVLSEIIRLILSFAAAWVVVKTATTIIKGVETAFSLLTGAINPVILVIGLLVAAVWWLVENWETVKSVAIRVWNAIKEAWAVAWEWFDTNIVTPIKEGFETALTAIGEFFAEAWAGIELVWAVVVEWFTNVWTSISDGFSAALVAVGEFFADAWAAIELAWAVVVEWFTSVWTAISDGFSAALTSVGEFFANAWAGIETAWGVVVEWFTTLITDIKDGFNAGLMAIGEFFTNAWSAIQEAWNAVVDWFITLVTDIKNGFDRALTAIGEFFINAWAGIEQAWGVVVAWFETLVTSVKEGFETALTAISGFFTTAWKAIETAWNGVVTWFTSVWTSIRDGFDTALAAVGKFFSDAWTGITDIWNGVIDWFSNIGTSIKDGFDTAIGKLKGFFTNAWEGIKNVWKGAVDWFTRTFIDPIRTAFDAIASTIKNIINGVIGFVNGMIGGVEDGINAVVHGINAIGGWLGINIGDVTLGRIPELATGAVIPPNSEFLAILGDQKRGTNIEAPEGLIRQIMQEELGKLQGGGGETVIRFEGDLAELGRVLRPVIQRESNRIGSAVLTGGEYA